MKTALGYQQQFEEMVQAGNITGALSMMQNDLPKQLKALKQYQLQKHGIMERPDKATYDEQGNFTGWVKRWKLPLDYARYINEMAVVFIYGRPVQWLQNSTGTDRAYQAFTDFIKDKHFNARIRQAKRLAGAETKSALLFHCYQNKDGKADCLIKVLAASLGDTLYYIKDQYDRLVYFARGYTIRERGSMSVRCVDIYTDDFIYHCKAGGVGWQVERETNFIGKKPVILFEQETEWSGAANLIERQEYMKSRTADVNDYMADPALVATADVVAGLPDKDTENKLYVLGENGKLEYLMPSAATDLKQAESEDNERHIFRDTFTPNIDFDVMSKLSNVSAKALKQMMVLASIKADMRKESHDEMLKRTGSLIKAILARVTNIELAGELERLLVEHEYQEPFGEDVVEAISNAIKEKNAGALSQETLIELNPLIRDKQREKDRIKAETEAEEAKEAERAANSVFNYQ
ncbi:MAG: phage portal protein [Lachnospiraceae bacterium]|nr:phage portal protein [Lachnospiraceae bacterium]